MIMNNRYFSWSSPKIEVRKTEKYGRGVFANETINSGEVVMVMGGNIVCTEDENRLGSFITEYEMDISEEFSFSPLTESDLDLMPQHLINHSCEPNVGFLDQLQIVAIKDINKDEELVYDYAFVMWNGPDNENRFEIKCLCGSKYCRGFIKEYDWKNVKIQQKYGRYFQPFLRKHFDTQ